MSGYRRYAIYYLLPEGPLSDFGARWLGWDVLHGREAQHPDLPGLPMPVEEITATPRKYGFHGTIKPPFRLAGGTSQDELETATAALAAALSPVELEGLALNRLVHFLALTPKGDAAPLAALAGRFVRELDRFRAPADEAELARRRGRGLSARQEAMLTEWGYPYVLDEFRFHMTLTGRLAETEGEAVRAALAPVVSPLLPAPFHVDSMCLAGSDETGRFHLVRRFQLG
ncbi:MAG: DUF1045 domain-containing protein [Pseudooceanicola sp.]